MNTQEAGILHGTTEIHLPYWLYYAAAILLLVGQSTAIVMAYLRNDKVVYLELITFVLMVLFLTLVYAHKVNTNLGLVLTMYASAINVVITNFFLVTNGEQIVNQTLLGILLLLAYSFVGGYLTRKYTAVTLSAVAMLLLTVSFFRSDSAFIGDSYPILVLIIVGFTVVEYRFIGHVEGLVSRLRLQSAELSHLNAQARESLRRTEANYKAVVEDQAELICRFDASGLVTFMNGACRRFIQPDSPHPATVRELMGDERWEEFDEQCRQLAPTEAVRLDEQLWHCDDGAHWIRWTLRRVGPRPQSREFQVVGTDVTEEVNAKSALIYAKEQAITANRSKSTFIANVSHEIRTPLTAIVGLNELILDATEESRREYVTQIRQSADALQRILNDVLSLSKIESGRIELLSSRFSVKEVIAQLQALFAEQAASKGLRFAFRLSEDVPFFVQGDRVRLLQVLANLIGNAVKYTEKGEIAVTVDRVQMPDIAPQDGTQQRLFLRFSVTDSGIGIAESDLKTIFDVFHQVDGSYTRRYEGVGLGLSISKRLVELMGGSITVHSEPAKGSTFSFDCPFGVAQDEQCGGHKKDSICRDDPERAASSAHVLVVEDYELNRKVLCRHLERHGHTPISAEGGESALEILTSQDVDIMLVDVQMPGMSGFSLAKKARELGRRRHRPIPIIAVTAFAEAGQQSEEDTGVFDAFLAKPIDFPRLFEHIDRLCTQSPEEEVSGQPAP